MKNLTLLFLAFCSLTFTSCFEFIEEIKIKKNGSGVYSYTIDMSGLMSKETRGLLSMLSAMDTTGAMANADMSFLDEEKDSTFNFKSLPPIEKAKFSRPDLLNNLTSRMYVSGKDEALKVSYTLKFKSVEDINFLMENFDDVVKLAAPEGGSSNPMESLGGGLGSGDGNPLQTGKYYYSKRKLTRIETDKESLDLASGGENMEMAAMFLKDAKYKIIYHVPKKVKSNTNEDAKVEKKTVVTEAPLMDYFTGKTKLGNTLKFK